MDHWVKASFIYLLYVVFLLLSEYAIVTNSFHITHCNVLHHQCPGYHANKRSLYKRNKYSQVINTKTVHGIPSADALGPMEVDPERQKIIARYTQQFPISLFRICGKSRAVRLREYAVQTAKGSRVFDVTLAEDNLIHPAPLDDIFIGPNGASLRPAGINLWDIISGKQGTVNLLEIPAGSKLPDGLVLLHEHGDHYSLQCTRSMTRKALEALMNEFLKDFPFYSKDEYFNKYPLARR